MRQVFKQKGFTLLELLIVIGIIGVLASVILITYPSATRKANLGNAMKFADNIRGALQQDMIAWWKFDENSGTVAKDTWWDQLHGNVYNGGVLGATWAEGINGKSLRFDGNDYVTVANNLGLENRSFTISVWVKPSTNINTGSRFSVAAAYSPGWLLDLVDDADQEGYRFFNGATAYKYTPPGGLISLQWTHWAVTLNKPTNNLKMYIDGKLKQTWTIGALTASANPLAIGRRTDGYYFNGLIDDVQIYSAVLSLSAVEQLYASGLKAHQNLLAEK